MFEIRQVVTPESVEDAFSALMANRNNRILGGCAFLKMGQKLINQGISLEKLELDFIRQQDGWIDIGAACTYGQLSDNALIQAYADGVIVKALQPIVGVQLRNRVQVGASVFSRYGFSDFLPVLLALGAEVTLHQGGRMPLETFLEQPLTRDVLLAVHLPDRPQTAACQSLRYTASDLPVVNCAVARDEVSRSWRIAIGARPGRAQLVPAASSLLTGKALSEAAIQHVLEAIALLTFGSNARASADYRQAMAKVLAQRAIQEVASC
ncbi:MAG: FAD binding domain-containing protein [Eubacteriales bacterium]|jgi:CO/xanthine dehydrogenase FAD-binding subunit|nr:FAD binding domain-containing protein [Eubacteriales bacterium]